MPALVSDCSLHTHTHGSPTEDFNLESSEEVGVRVERRSLIRTITNKSYRGISSESTYRDSRGSFAVALQQNLGCFEISEATMNALPETGSDSENVEFPPITGFFGSTQTP